MGTKSATMRAPGEFKRQALRRLAGVGFCLAVGFFFFPVGLVVDLVWPRRDIKPDRTEA